MRIFIEDSFDSAHRLTEVPPSHKCARLHGHTYRIRIEIQGPVHPDSGWIVDYAVVKSKWESIKTFLDHQCLNDLPTGKETEELMHAMIRNPTCENIANWIGSRIGATQKGLARIELRETEHCGVVWEP